MIKGSKCKDTQKLFNREKVKRFPQAIQRVALRKLAQLDSVFELGQLRIPPGNHLETLHGNRNGQYSIRINNQWRICFKWEKQDCTDVEIIDYH